MHEQRYIDMIENQDTDTLLDAITEAGSMHCFLAHVLDILAQPAGSEEEKLSIRDLAQCIQSDVKTLTDAEIADAEFCGND